MIYAEAELRLQTHPADAGSVIFPLAFCKPHQSLNVAAMLMDVHG
jgi:hypothetical protein